MNNDFSFRNHTVLRWLGGVALVAAALAIFFPPAFWLCVVGFVFFGIGLLAYSARTDQWMSWQHEGRVNWFEGWCFSTAVVLALVPLLIDLARFPHLHL